jgi:hypothetical protein
MLGQSDGLVVWHIQQDANHNPTKVKSPIGPNLTLAVWAEGSPNLIPGCPISLWGSGTRTPSLKWISGGQTATALYVTPFNQGDNSITVQWLSPSDTWVDFGFTGTQQNGTFANPYKTLAAGVNAATYGGTLHLKTGSSSETLTISKAVTLVDYNGPATIGH